MRFTTLEQWLRWQESLHPTEIDLGLDRVQQVLQRMQLPAPTFKVINVAGTNGKGSCVTMLDAIYRAAGYKVGTYTSPHIKRYNERITVNGQMVSDDALCRMFERVDQCREEISLTYFEFGTLAAIGLLHAAQVDVAIMEVGLGGRLDAVNILDADVALITRIGLDHRAWLGDSRDAVALEKAGIARAHRPTVCGDPEPPHTLVNYLGELQSPLYQVNRDFHYRVTDNSHWDWQHNERRYTDLPLPTLRGDFQLLNAASVLMAVELLRVPVKVKAIAEGLRSAVLPGRFQVIDGDVMTIVDVAHNPQSAEALAATLASWPSEGKTRAVFAVLKDKDVAGILQPMLDLVDEWFIAQLGVERAMPYDELLSIMSKVGQPLRVKKYDSVELAKQAAMAQSHPGDRIVIFGSFYTVAEVL